MTTTIRLVQPQPVSRYADDHEGDLGVGLLTAFAMVAPFYLAIGVLISVLS